ncbi:MAG: CDP-diacylglycerol--glycerol-3-phosphate 3-phosphatidyltransferase [Rhodobacteraceae bacterium]|nr:CDP-diacylglycerol--glycerol-3-phosphate 3-phosphatidyltransferase [Paracoccaceae bacterium]
MTITLPTILSIFRLFAGFLILFGFLLLARPTADILAFVIFVCAAITDFIDGYIARKFNLVSELGKILDSIADKILVIMAWIIIITYYEFNSWIILPIGLIIFRELFISGLREYLASKSLSLQVTFIAKLKTTLQMITISLTFFLGIIVDGSDSLITFLLQPVTSSGTTLVEMACVVLIWLSAFQTIYTGWEYFKTALGLMVTKNDS